jgi:hypothetical protein
MTDFPKRLGSLVVVQTPYPSSNPRRYWLRAEGLTWLFLTRIKAFPNRCNSCIYRNKENNPANVVT